MNNISLTSWLKKRTKSESPLNITIKDDYDLYYNDNDIDMKLNNNLEIMMIEDGEMNYDDTYIERYSTGEKVFINPETKRYHISQLYKQLINFNEDNNLNISYPISDNKYIEIDIFNKDMKEKFYEFCKNNNIN